MAAKTSRWRHATTAVVRAVLPVVLALVVAGLIIAAMGKNPFDFFWGVWKYGITGTNWQDSLVLMAPLLIIAVGLTSLMATMGYWFEWVRLAGAAYLVWLGIKLMGSSGVVNASDAPPPPPRGGFFLQGFLVLLSNPKVLVFFGAFIPQFVDMKQDHLPQVVVLGITFMIIAALSDGAYALLAGRAGKLLSARRVRLVSRISGGFMIGGGIWLALTSR